MWKKVCQRAGIKNIRQHDFSHTWVSWMRQQGKGVGKIQDMGGGLDGLTHRSLVSSVLGSSGKCDGSWLVRRRE